MRHLYTHTSLNGNAKCHAMESVKSVLNSITSFSNLPGSKNFPHHSYDFPKFIMRPLHGPIPAGRDFNLDKKFTSYFSLQLASRLVSHTSSWSLLSRAKEDPHDS